MFTETLLRRFIREVILQEVDVLSPNDDPRQGGQSRDLNAVDQKNGASKQYVPKEKTREKLQKMLQRKVTSGQFAEDEDLANYLRDPKIVAHDGEFDPTEDVSLAITALRGVPLSVWKQLPST